MTEAYIYDAIRTPRGKGRADGSLNEVTSVRLSATVLNELKARNGFDGHVIEDVIWGNVTQVGEQGGCLARSAVLASELDERIPGLAINRFCASGMEAVNLAANQMRAGAGDAYIAGGVEMMSRVPMGSDGAAIAVDPIAGDGHLFRAAGHFAPISSRRNTGFRATIATPLLSKARSARRPPGRTIASTNRCLLFATRTVCRSCPKTNTCVPAPICRRLAR